jgi:hypothetical protein
MASAGSGGGDGRSNTCGDEGARPNVTNLLRKLQLTEDEEAITEFSDDEEIEATMLVE